MSDLPEPIGRQREVLYLPAEGHTVVLGTAGSGKTTLAILRAAYLADPSLVHCGRTLLLTFNNALVTYLNHLKPRGLRNVQTETYHRFARGYLNSKGKMSYNCICDPDTKDTLIARAVKNIAQNYKQSQFFKRPLKFFVDEIQWILSNGITSEDEYRNVERVGRVGTNLARKLRDVMYEILKEYIRLREDENKLYDWDDVALHTRLELESDSTQRMYKHIVIDEGQDFTPEMLRSLVNAILDDGTLTFFGDVAQQIYGQRMSWRSAGLTVPKVWEFKENYRNTREIARLGIAITQMPYFNGIADLVEPSTPRAQGELPVLVKCSDLNKETEVAVRYAKANSKNQSVAVLFRNRRQENAIKRSLPQNAIRLHRDMSTWQAGPGIRYGTYHSAKGLEFDMAILPFLSKDNLPDSEDVGSLGRDDALTHDGRLLYVAVTRAKTRLFMSYSGELTELLPIQNGLYRKETL